MKKGYLLIVALALVFMIFQVPEAKAVTEWYTTKDAIVVKEGPYTYHAYTSVDNQSCWIYLIEIDNNKVEEATELSIPSELKGRKVTRLGYDFPEEDKKVEFYSNIFGVVVEREFDVDGYSPMLKNLTKLTIPDTVEEIEQTCFSGVKNVKTIELPPNVKKIYRETFYGCYYLQKIVLPEKLEYIEVDAFEECSQLKDIEISKNNENYYVKKGFLIEKKEQRAIMLLQAKKTVTIPKGVKVLGTHLLADGRINKVVIPASVQDVEVGALHNKYIKNISIAKSSKYLAWDGQCIYDKQDLSLVVAKPNKKGYLRISNKVIFLEDEANLIGRKNVEILVVPGSVTTLGLNGLYVGRSHAQKLYFLGETPPELLEYRSDYSSLPSFAHLYVRKKALSTYKKWYGKYGNLYSVKSWNTFMPSDLRRYTRADEDKKKSTDYEYQKTNGTIGITKYIGKKKHVVIPAKINGLKVTHIGQSAFEDQKIVSVKFPATVKVIGRSAFESCKKLKRVEIPNSVEDMEARAFMGCKSLKEFQIPNRIEILHGKCFKRCVKLKTIKIPESVRQINMQCFAGCRKLEKVDLPKDLLGTESGVFMNCKSLKRIVLPDGLSHLSGSLFKGCVNLEEVTVKGVITGLGSGTFYNCYRLKKLQPIRITESIYYDAFKNCRNLEATIEIMPGCYGISSGAFVNCPKIKIKNIENAAFVSENAFDEAE